MLHLNEVSKRYGRSNWVLENVSLALSPGEIVAVKGANGSGKSTLLRLVSGVSRPTKGSVIGLPAVIGYVPERFPPNERLSATSYLTHMGRIRGLAAQQASRRADALLERLALAGDRRAPLRTLSKGNAQKVALAQALLVMPELMVLDEPWSGLDSSAHEVLGQILKEVAYEGGSVLFTDHRESVTQTRTSRSYLVRDGRVTPVWSRRQPSGDFKTVSVTLAGGATVSLNPSHWLDVIGVLDAVRTDGTLLLRVEAAHSDNLLLHSLRNGCSIIEVTRPSAEGDRR